MKRHFSYRPTLAFFLAATIFQTIVLKEAHRVFGHHGKEAHCFTNGNDRHLHSQEYANPDCQVCFFHFSPARLGTSAIFLKNPSAIRGHYFARQDVLPVLFPAWHFSRRGPPVSAV